MPFTMSWHPPLPATPRRSGTRAPRRRIRAADCRSLALPRQPRPGRSTDRGTCRAETAGAESRAHAGQERGQAAAALKHDAAGSPHRTHGRDGNPLACLHLNRGNVGRTDADNGQRRTCSAVLKSDPCCRARRVSFATIMMHNAHVVPVARGTVSVFRAPHPPACGGGRASAQLVWWKALVESPRWFFFLGSFFEQRLWPQ